ncbi:hypothetical protein SAMN05660831_00880 [Thiohalospira halophila DSM 15071]|uniref:Motility protein n=1 Tax=Thiohalospira halophila DSM 15071 TaxID=1123397 RepID=A0A1I1Q9S5_9GAMM|nr:hypothetical protein [Thiohalospira halophila]SFD14870.1 hypothetical protein SAMN05660831_00880 [Thiohalospira halophila DSM 15071]
MDAGSTNATTLLQQRDPSTTGVGLQRQAMQVVEANTRAQGEQLRSALSPETQEFFEKGKPSHVDLYA